MVCASLSITGGYHRLFSHSAYKAAWPVRLFYLAFGASSFQNSAIKWAIDHRRHHAKVDTDKDPYNINRGFWWAHIGWVFFMDPKGSDVNEAKDLMSDRLIMFQHNYYFRFGAVIAYVIPTLLGCIWGDPLGAFILCGSTRLILQYHFTFAINSYTHMFGRQPYSLDNSARDSFGAALLTMGEGYHNFHHRFQTDYRNGIRWYHYDPTKWFVWALSKVGLTSNLRVTAKSKIERALANVRAQKAEATQTLAMKSAHAKQVFAEKSAHAKQVLAEKSASAQAYAHDVSVSAQALAHDVSDKAQALAHDVSDKAHALAEDVREKSEEALAPQPRVNTN
ncbi:UNVERIFIED_CONTAM: hypothetical protein GTU68_014432 [Idotea baltica]|nr:hypothetical protein [Idotea baltica]